MAVEPERLEQIEGMVERVTFRNEGNGFTILRLSTGGKLLTVVGSFASIAVGQTLELSGQWGQHPQYGRQFQAKEYKELLPVTAGGIEKYLASGLIRGIGPALAHRLVTAFGKDTLRVIEKDPERLHEVPGLGPQKIEAITAAFRDQSELREVMVFLQSHGITPGYAARIYRHYGPETITTVQENPYRLAAEVFGIGFKTADALARGLGLPVDAPERIRAGLLYALGELAGDGHTCVPAKDLTAKAAEMLEVEPERAAIEIAPLREDKSVIAEPQAGPDDDDLIYLTPFFVAEQGVAHALNRLNWEAAVLDRVNPDAEMSRFETERHLELAGEQREAIKAALSAGVTVITGGPGTGKTTIIRALLDIFDLNHQKVLLAAPTGRAAKRLGEATGREAKTIHRLLEYAYQEGEGMAFNRNQDNPLDADAVVVDEVSMMDIVLMYHFLRALKPQCRLVLVGDVDQLPSVGPGNVLQDVIKSNTIPCVRLQTVFRQARESMIVVNAHRINMGEFPYLNLKEKDFFFIEEKEPEKVAAAVVDLVSRRLPQAYGFNPFEDIQVLTPMRRSTTGVEALNLDLQNRLNPSSPGKSEVSVSGQKLREGDRVMQIKNDYQKQVFNGDIGRVEGIDQEAGLVHVSFAEPEGTRIVSYEFDDLDSLTLCYACSVHKSQGSEYPAVVMPVVTQHYIMLQRNLLYTAVTRAKKLVVLVGSKQAVGMSVRNNKVQTRYSYLSERLRRSGENAQLRMMTKESGVGSQERRSNARRTGSQAPESPRTGTTNEDK
jgi:exodeoxyribonuclease V alpha subunit